MSRASTTTDLPLATIFIMAVASALTVANVYFNQALLPAIATGFSVSPREAGLVATLSQLGYALGIVLVVPLGDRAEPRSLIRFLLLGVAVVLLAASSSPTLSILAFLSVLICMGTCVPQIVLPLAAGLAQPERRGRVIAAVQTGLILGILLSRTLAGLAGATFGWRPVYVIAAVLMAVSALILPAILPRRGSAPTALLYLPLLASLWGLLRREPQLRLSCLLGATTFAAFSAFWTTIAFRLGQPPFGLDLGGIGLFALWGGIGGLASPMAGGLIDRFGQDRASAATIGIAALTFVIAITFPTQYVALVVAANLISFGLSVGQIANQARIFALGSEARSRLNTVYMAITFAGSAVGSAAGGTAWASWGWMGVCVFALVCVAIAAVALAMAKRNRNHEGE